MLFKYDILLFDSDNTLYNHDIHEHTALFEAFDEYGMSITEEQYFLYRKINDDIWKEIELGMEFKDDPLIERFCRFAEKTGLSFVPEDINRIYANALSRQCSPFPESFDVCKKLSETHRLYIITNGTDFIQLRRFEKSPLRPFFSGIFTAAALGIQKPKKEFFDRLFAKLGNPDRSRAVVIGDSLTSDILGGVNAGIDTVWFNPSHAENTKPFSPTYEISNLMQLLPVR